MADRLHFLRAPIVHSDQSARVDKENRVIRGVSVMTVGEAQGHDAWVDAAALQQLVDHANARTNKAGTPIGLKTRFTHPGLSADGMGKQIGRTRDLTVDGEIARGDLQLYRTVENPERLGMIQDVMNLAEEDPEAFGMSIVFARDGEAEKAFMQTHSVTQGAQEVFASPDSRNTNNYPHFRIKAVRASDVVDEPAANEGFLSEGEELASRAEAVLTYAFGLTETPPDSMALGGIPAAKIRVFLNGFLTRHQLSIAPLAAPAPGGMVTCPDCSAEFEPTGDPASEQTCPDCGTTFMPSDMDKDGMSAVAEPVLPPVVTDAPASLVEIPVCAGAVEQLGAITYEAAHPHGTPLDENSPWDGGEEVKHATVQDLQVMCAYVTDGKTQVKSGYKLPHHKAAGEHTCVRSGMHSAAARLPQTDMSDAARAIARTHIAEHYHEFNEKAPWERNTASWAAYEQGVACLMLRGGVTDSELGTLLGLLGFALESATLCHTPIVESPVPAVPAAVSASNGTLDITKEQLDRVIQQAAEMGARAGINAHMGRLTN